ncbi:MAG: FecR domain-containing protein, partial [Elusimicrobia bacterium]|nr:FecR domain-containing protein [Elusimicrobiota bacterium]
DRVRTGAGAVAQVVLDGDRGAVLVREDSSFTLEGDPENTMLDFRVGEFLVGLRKSLTQGQTFKVRTPAAVAAVRGTLFWGKSDDAKTTTYAGFGHSIEVTAKGKTVVVGAGEKTVVAFGEAPAPAAKHDIPVSYTDRFKVDGGLQSLETLADLPKP